MKQMYLHRSSSGQEPPIKRGYDKQFKPTAAYRASLPDMMEVANKTVRGVHVPIQQVGIHNFKLPLKYRTKAGKILTLETSVTGTVSLEADLKGIDMSRIMRSFYEHKDGVTTGEWMGKILKGYLRKVVTKDARLKIAFSYPMLAPEPAAPGSRGCRFYNVAFEGVMTRGRPLPPLHPLRLRLLVRLPVLRRAGRARPRQAEGLRRAALAAQQGPHHDRGGRGQKIWIEDIHALCLKALRTETPVMVKREDEQAFAELNGAYLKFSSRTPPGCSTSNSTATSASPISASPARTSSRCTPTTPSSAICKGVKDGFKADFMDFGSLLCYATSWVMGDRSWASRRQSINFHRSPITYNPSPITITHDR